MPITDLYSIFPALTRLINEAYIILISIAVLILVYGLFKFIANAGDPAARKEGRSFILWAVIGIFVMTSVWGLVNILKNTFQLDENMYDDIFRPLIPDSALDSSSSGNTSGK